MFEMFKGNDGKYSMMRFAVIWAIMVGAAVAFSGIFVRYLDAGTRSVCVVTGAGMITSALGAKAIQKNAEVKNGH